MKTICMIATIGLVFFSCQNSKEKEIQAAKQATLDSMKVVAEKQRVIDSMQTEMDKQEALNEKKEVTVINQTTTTAEPKRKKWSNTAKGAVIGAGVGAVTGAIISKKKGEGAIIGGVAGAGVGAGTGAIIDDSKKNP